MNRSNKKINRLPPTNRKILFLSIIFIIIISTLSIVFADQPSGVHTLESSSINKFITLDFKSVVFLFILGLIGGLVSGFIGSGAAFILTPGMMMLGVPATVAIASNMCQKFPKALVGGYKRFKYGQVDIKLGLIIALSAVFGVILGIRIQEYVKDTYGPAGSDLYVSLAFVVVLLTVGGFVFYDAFKISKSGETKKTYKLTHILQKINIPPMIHFKTAKITISFWITLPLGFATGLLAATIAVGGFIGVPGMIYALGVSSLVASATELVIAFVMGLGGSIDWALSGTIDIRLVLIVLGGSLFGVQLGAIGTTYVKENVIKIVMGSIMLIVALTRILAIPIYLDKLNIIELNKSLPKILNVLSFIFMSIALATGTIIILFSMWKGKKMIVPEKAISLKKQKKLLVAVNASKTSKNTLKQAINLARNENYQITAISVIMPFEGDLEFSSVGDLRWAMKEPCVEALSEALDIAETENIDIDLFCKEGEIDKAIVQHAETEDYELIVLGRKRFPSIERVLTGSISSRVINHSKKDVLVVPEGTKLDWNNILLVIDYSDHSDTITNKAIDLAKHYGEELKVLSVFDMIPHSQSQAILERAIQKSNDFVNYVKKNIEEENIKVDLFIQQGEPYKIITDFAINNSTTMIIIGNYRRSGFKGIIIETIAEKITKHVPCSVLVVK